MHDAHNVEVLSALGSLKSQDLIGLYDFLTLLLSKSHSSSGAGFFNFTDAKYSEDFPNKVSHWHIYITSLTDFIFINEK